MTLLNDAVSSQLEIPTSFWINSDSRSYPILQAIFLISSFVRGNLPCLSQQLWQSGQRHFQRMYKPSFLSIGMWKMTWSTTTRASAISCLLPRCKSYTSGSIFQDCESNSRDSLTPWLDSNGTLVKTRRLNVCRTAQLDRFQFRIWAIRQLNLLQKGE